MDTRRRISFNMNTGGGQPSEPSTGGTYTVNLNNAWQLSTTIINPDSTLYDGVYQSYANKGVHNSGDIMYIDIEGLESFKLYIRSYAESSWDYIMVSQLDKTLTYNSSYSDTSLVKAHTRGNQNSGTSINNYTLVEFTGIDGGKHRISIIYRKDSSSNSGDDRGYVLIPKSNGSSGSGGNTPDNPGTGGDTSGPINTDNYLTILALENGLTASLSTNACQYCIDGDGNWIDLPSGTTTQTINSGQTLSFRGNLTPKSYEGIGTFSINKKCNLEGNCMSMLFGDNAVNNSLSGKDYAFYKLFNGCTTIVQVSKTFLPATTLARSCYQFMFQDCTSLTVTPELPATILINYCYHNMFCNCTSLTTAPELPATTLSGSCYYSMFIGCTSLTTVPELPATTLQDSCYRYMFRNCTSLTTAPELPATTLARSCYQYMFQNCSKLNYIKMLTTNISATNCLSNWVSGVSSTGTFVKNPAMTSLTTGTSGIPSGWTVYNAGDANEPEGPEIPQVAGDVAYYTNGEIKTISASKWNTSLGTPIGVVVIPSNFLPDGKARILSLKAVDSNGNATTSHSSIIWSTTSTDTTLTNYTKVPITNNTGSVSSSSNSSGYLPSDNFTGDTSFVDGSAKYGTTDTTKIPSPYNGSEFNTDYSKNISGNNALSDFNGLNNTQVLVGLGSDYAAANAAYNYNDGISNIQWYLPAMGELGFMVARFKSINNTISQLSGVAVPSYRFWSSTEYSSANVYYMYTDSGGVYNYLKASSNYVRPFALLYNNGKSNLITFTINGTQYQAEEGMTWEEFVNSDYNVSSDYYIEENKIRYSHGGGPTYVIYNDEFVLITEVIVNQAEYNSISTEPE